MDDSKLLYRADPKKNITVPKNLFQWIKMAFISPANYLLMFQDLKLTKASSYFVFFTLINLFLFFLGLLISRTKYDISLPFYVMSNSYFLFHYFYLTCFFLFKLAIIYGIIYIPYFILVSLFQKIFQINELPFKKNLRLFISLQVYNVWFIFYPIFPNMDWAQLIILTLSIGFFGFLWRGSDEKYFDITVGASWVISIRVLVSLLESHLDFLFDIASKTSFILL
ncbi:hypothetical protein [Dethiosulfatarculus sandiegensis]|uniref:Uncharacterized protein n=1 Tax=Dethiosulfatarculus sandiegensis TaxID=1429043 RepID=A0A0D2J4V9_9BACT|nr:hypothetical protein [Dethiosulfatarculus sandiegensis]KIX13174.1 hypothetical protein X474_15735 [Dethiosulfatarculus sandiegensis]